MGLRRTAHFQRRERSINDFQPSACAVPAGQDRTPSLTRFNVGGRGVWGGEYAHLVPHPDHDGDGFGGAGVLDPKVVDLAARRAALREDRGEPVAVESSRR